MRNRQQFFSKHFLAKAKINTPKPTKKIFFMQIFVNPAALLSVILDGHCSRHTDATSRGIEQGSVAPFCLHRLSTSISRIKPQYLVN